MSETYSLLKSLIDKRINSIEETILRGLPSPEYRDQCERRFELIALRGELVDAYRRAQQGEASR
jgi:hypothetical protein